MPLPLPSQPPSSSIIDGGIIDEPIVVVGVAVDVAARRCFAVVAILVGGLFAFLFYPILFYPILSDLAAALPFRRREEDETEVM